VAKNPFDDPIPGPNAIFVRLGPGRNPTAALGSLNRIATALSSPANFGVAVAGVQRPAEIITYRSVGTTPALLGGALAAGAVVALGLTLLTSVRRRRRDLAVLKTLGFTGRQLAAAVAWQSSVAVALGILVGIPLGMVLGRGLWDLFAREIHAVPHPTVPVLPILLIAAGGLVLANLVAAIPGRIAARTPTALILRAG
jgi:ABC-type antimicrobial peptide transport system permease subunit